MTEYKWIYARDVTWQSDQYVFRPEESLPYLGHASKSMQRDIKFRNMNSYLQHQNFEKPICDLQIFCACEIPTILTFCLTLISSRTCKCPNFGTKALYT